MTEIDPALVERAADSYERAAEQAGFGTNSVDARGAHRQWMTAALRAINLPDLLRKSAELDALRARIAAAPVAIMDTRAELGLCAPTEDDFPGLYALQGQRVRLLVEGQGDD